jgi:hypothetical protein
MSTEADRTGYWAILTDCEKDATTALATYRKRTLIEFQFDNMKNDLAVGQLSELGSDKALTAVVVFDWC